MADGKTTPDEPAEDKKSEERILEKSVEDTFPASDPPSETQPGGGVTEPEKIDPAKIPRG